MTGALTAVGAASAGPTVPAATASVSAPDRNAAERLELAVTHHRLPGGLAYTAEAGYLDLLEDAPSAGVARPPEVTARIFHTAYLAEVAESERLARPVIFVFNGGPGASSAWLHLGLVGPRRIDNSSGDRPFAPPYRLLDNLETPLRYADLVLIDPVDTGYSRAAEGVRADLYHGVDEDVQQVTHIIRLWTSRHDRWASPLFLAGESYGVLRGAKVAAELARQWGLYLRGLILISSTLGGGDFMRFGPGALLSTPAFLPTYAAVAHYHGFHLGRSLAEVVQEAQDYATGDLLGVLAAGHRLPGDRRQAAIVRLAALTGLSPQYLDRVNLKVDKRRFYAELLRERGLTVGEIDGRFTGWNPDQAGEVAQHDPTDQAIRGAFGAGINHYLRHQLGYRNDLPYELISHRVRPWRGPKDSFAGFNSLGALSEVLRVNAHLRVQYHLGYYDVCTPYWGAETDLAQLELPPAELDRVEVVHYESGHMIYLDEASRRQELADIERFVTGLIA